MRLVLTGIADPDCTTADTGEPVGSHNGQDYWTWTNGEGTWYLWYHDGDNEWNISHTLGGTTIFFFPSATPLGTYSTYEPYTGNITVDEYVVPPEPTGTGTSTSFRESEGPDRFRHTVQCREFHDLPSESLGGSAQCCCCDPCNHIRPYRAGGQVRCCRCVPRLLYLHFIPEEVGTAGCCREFYVPMVHNPHGNSPEHSADDLVSGYVGTFFGLLCYAEVGRVGDLETEIPGLGEFRKCGWHIIVYDGASKIVDEFYPIDFDRTGTGTNGSCSEVPTGTIATGIEGYSYQKPEDPVPTTCLYSVSLEQMAMSRVPFQQVSEVKTFLEARPSEGDPEIITLDPPWKTITEVCSRICVAGPRHAADSMTYKDYKTFTWFENIGYAETGTGTGTSSGSDSTQLIERGWSYYNQDTERTEYVYLEKEPPQIYVNGILFDRAYGTYSFGSSAYPYWYGKIGGVDSYIYVKIDRSAWALMIGGNEEATGPTDLTEPYGSYTDGTVYTVTRVTGYDPDKCYLHPRFEELAENEEYDTVPVDLARLCSTNLFETLCKTESRFITIRCGFCQCWDFYCKYCRCVPTQLCMTYWTVDGASDDNVLTWDDDLKGWQNEECPIQLLLVRNWNGSSKYDDQYDADDCMIVPNVTDSLGTGTGTVIGEDYQWPDGQAHYNYNSGTEPFTKIYDWDAGLIRYSYIDGVNNLYIWAMSMVPECSTWPCGDEATGCGGSCGNHPTKLYGVLSQQRPGPGGDDPTVYPVVEFEFEAVLVKSVMMVTEEGIQIACSYVGYIPSYGDCCGAMVSISNGGVSIGAVGADGCLSPIWSLGSETLTEDCDPYHLYGYMTGGTTHIWARCLYPDWIPGDDGVGGSIEITE